MRKSMNRVPNMSLAIALLAVAGFAAAAGEVTEDRPLALRGLDPVLLVQGKEVEGTPGHTAHDDRYTYRFATEETLAKFLGAPERFGVQGDGSCPVSPGATADPGIFTVHDGRIYTFATPGCVETFQDDPDYFLKPRELQARNVAILVFDGVELLDFSGPGEVFASAAHGRAFEVYTVGESREGVFAQGFVEIKPQYTIEDSPAPEILIVPGGGVENLLRSEKVMEWIKTSARDAITLSVCNGAFVLAGAGLLDGREATTHHGSIGTLRERAPDTVVHADRRWVDNGSVITSAGVSAGIDASLHLVHRLLGAERAQGVARYMEYDWTPEDEDRGLVRRASSDSKR